MKNSNYLVQPEYRQPRAENTLWQDLVKAKWKYLPGGADTHSNIAFQLRFDVENHRFFFLDNMFDLRFHSHTLGDVISSAFMLYKLLCLEYYPQYPRIQPQNKPYKVLWKISLQHKATGEKFVIEDYKVGLYETFIDILIISELCL